jgi:hypothetical protein
VQEAFAEGRLDDTEFDERMRAALTARTRAADEEDPGYRLPADAPVIHVRGLAYKGAVEITTRPPERPPAGPSRGAWDDGRRDLESPGG